MLLVLEGTKRSGKTSFANLLRENMHYNVFYLYDRLDLEGNSKVANIALAYGYMRGAIAMAKDIIQRDSNAIILLDRFHLTEMIYGLEERGYNNSLMWDVDERLLDLGAKGILFISDTADERTEIKSYKEQFKAAADNSKLNWTVVNLDKVNGHITVPMAVTILESIEKEDKKW